MLIGTILKSSWDSVLFFLTSPAFTPVKATPDPCRSQCTLGNPKGSCALGLNVKVQWIKKKKISFVSVLLKSRHPLQLAVWTQDTAVELMHCMCLVVTQAHLKGWRWRKAFRVLKSVAVCPALRIKVRSVNRHWLTTGRGEEIVQVCN